MSGENLLTKDKFPPEDRVHHTQHIYWLSGSSPHPPILLKDLQEPDNALNDIVHFQVEVIPVPEGYLLEEDSCEGGDVE